MTPALTIENPAYFDHLADVESRHWWSLGMWRLTTRWLDRELKGRVNLRALDLGCGTGFTALHLAARPEIVEVVGLDPSPEALKHARRRHDFPLVRGSALGLPFEDSRFDVVTCFDAFQHLPRGGDKIAAAELRRVLAPGGVAVVRSNARARSRPGAAYRLEELCDVLQSEGLSVARATYANWLPSLVQEVRGRLVSGGQSAHPSGGGLRITVPHAGVNRLMLGVSAFEAWVSGSLGLPLPSGHSTMVMAVRRG